MWTRGESSCLGFRLHEVGRVTASHPAVVADAEDYAEDHQPTIMHAMLRYASRAVVGVGASTLATTAFADGKEPPLSYRPPFVAPQSTNAAWVQSMKEGKAMMGCAVNSSSSLVTEICAATGFDFLLIDAQHSAVNPETLRHLLQACHAGGAKAFVRVGGHNDRVGIQQACDLGADGVLVGGSVSRRRSKAGLLLSTAIPENASERELAPVRH